MYLPLWIKKKFMNEIEAGRMLKIIAVQTIEIDILREREAALSQSLMKAEARIKEIGRPAKAEDGNE